MATEIWGLPTCDTCRKARRALPDAVFRDIRSAPLSTDEIAVLLASCGDKVINRASTTWRGLDAGERDLAPAELLNRHPAVMKRPVIHHDGVVHLGFTPAVRAALALDQVRRPGSQQLQVASR